jgi:quercetin dioxygenase-like cupin family protein
VSAFSRLKLITTLSVLAMAAASSGIAEPDRMDKIDKMAGALGENLAAALPLLPADHPRGTEATVTLVSLRRASGLDEPTLSTFIVDYSPGGSAVLHRAPSAGYVLVYVLSGAIRAFAWDAGVGTYRAGETWAEPAFAHNIATTNASTAEPARALVVLVTGSDGIPESRE